MKNKTATKSAKSKIERKPVRVRSETKKKALLLLDIANKGKTKRKFKLDQLFDLAIDLVTEEQIKLLQTKAMTNSERQEILRKKYSELYGPVTTEEFIGITWTAPYFEFLKEHGHLISAA